MTRDEGAALAAVARAAIEDALFGNGALARARGAIAMTPALCAPSACFVTLKRPGAQGGLELRGCIGCTAARRAALDAVADAAREAALEDPRFEPVTPSEFPMLHVTVAVLTPFLPIADASEIAIGEHGVVLDLDGRQALFLPEVAVDHGWSRGVLLEQLARKAGLPAGAWRRARLSTFRSERFGDGGDDGADRIPRS